MLLRCSVDSCCYLMLNVSASTLLTMKKHSTTPHGSVVRELRDATGSSSDRIINGILLTVSFCKKFQTGYFKALTPESIRHMEVQGFCHSQA